MDEAGVGNTFTADDAERIFNIKLSTLDTDIEVWGFTEHGFYSSHKGFRLIDLVHENHTTY